MAERDLQGTLKREQKQYKSLGGITGERQMKYFRN